MWKKVIFLIDWHPQLFNSLTAAEAGPLTSLLWLKVKWSSAAVSIVTSSPFIQHSDLRGKFSHILLQHNTKFSRIPQRCFLRILKLSSTKNVAEHYPHTEHAWICISIKAFVIGIAIIVYLFLLFVGAQFYFHTNNCIQVMNCTRTAVTKT